MNSVNTPGISLFQGAESLKLDTSSNRLAEEEDLEDRQRRNEELKNELENAFDDLIDDEDNTVDSSVNFQSNVMNDRGDGNPMGRNREYNNINGNDNNPHYNQPNNAVFDQLERLKMELESKNMEIENISKIAHEERKKNDALQKRLALSEAERERANMGKAQQHELLVESKAKCSELDDVILKLKVKIKSIEATNNDLVGQLERTQSLLADAEQKYHLVEKNVNFANDRNVDLWKKQIEDRHHGQVEMMQQQIDGVRNKLEDRENELKNMDTRYRELQRSREALLIDKSQTINQLSKSLEDAQKQCQQLMAKQDYAQENVRLQRLVSELERQTEDMQRTINTLKARLDATTAELELMDSVLHENSEDTPRRFSIGKGHFTGSTPLTTTDRLGRLKDELYRCMAGQKEKREEIRKLKDTLVGKNEEIKTLKNEENKSLVEITTCKEENTRLKNRLRLIEEELDELKAKSVNRSQNENILQSNRRLKDELTETKADLNALHRKMSTNDDSERRKIDAQIKNLNIDLEELKQEHDSLKLNYENILRENDILKQRKTSDTNRLELEKLKFLLKDSQNECNRYKNMYVELSNAKEAIALEMAKLKNTDFCKDLHEEKSRAASLQQALQLAELKTAEMSKILETQKNSHEKDLDEMRNRLEKEKVDSFKSTKNTSNNCTKCIEQIAEVTKLEIQNLKYSNQCAGYLKDICNLQAQLAEAKVAISDLNEKIGLKDERDQLINDLKLKAEQFEEYIKTQSSSGVSSPKQTDFDSSQSKKEIEAKLRNEMSKIFAIDLKNMEQHFRMQLEKFEQENSQLKRDLSKIAGDLNQRQKDLEFMRKVLFSERDKMEEILKKKDAEKEEIFQHSSILIHKVRDELKQTKEKVTYLTRELDERDSQIAAERESMKAVMQQWEEQRKNSDQKNDHWKKTVSDLKADHGKTVEMWRVKYNSAKKTAFNYKRYAEEKEAHMIREYDRIKGEYDASLEKIQHKMHEAFEVKKNEMKATIAEIEMKYRSFKPLSQATQANANTNKNNIS